MAKASFYKVLTAAIREFVTRGFSSQKQLEEWMKRIEQAAKESLIPEHMMQSMLQRALRSRYRKYVDEKGLFKRHKGVSLFTVEKIAPRLRAELDRRIMASANLIVLNRKNAIAKTLQRFAGWATSIPDGGTKVANPRKATKEVRKALASLPFQERRVLIDQGHKLISSINEIVAEDGGAIAAVWHSNWKQPNYNYREDHKERDNRVYLVRGNWAQQQGLVKPNENGYVDEHTRPGEEVFCRCYHSYLYTLRDLPEDMLTAKGRLALNPKKVA